MITVDQIIQKNINLDVTISRLANLAGIYSFKDLTELQQSKLISIYYTENRGTFEDALDGIDLKGSTTFNDMELVQQELSDIAAYEIDSCIEDEWADEFNIEKSVNDIVLDNRFRNGDLFGVNC